jgi:hypothetical protein
MEKEMDMVFGNQQKIITIFMKVNIWKIEKVVLVYINGQMDLFMRESLVFFFFKKVYFIFH